MWTWIKIYPYPYRQRNNFDTNCVYLVCMDMDKPIFFPYPHGWRSNFDTTSVHPVDADIDKILSISISVNAKILTQTARHTAVSHFATILFTKRTKGYNLLGGLHHRSRSKFGVVFLQTTTFAQSVFFLQHSSAQLLKWTNEIEKQILPLWADSERRTANNMVLKTTFTRARQATSMVVGWTWESGCQESTVKSVKAKPTISVERERTLSPIEPSIRWEWFNIDRFRRKMSQRTVVEVIKRQKTQKKSRHNGLNTSTSSALTRLLLTPHFRHFFGVVMKIWKKAAASIQKKT